VPGQVKPKFCRECGYSFIENNFNTYTTPVTITEQLIKLNSLDGARDAILGLTQGKALSVLEDAQKIMETIAGRKTATVDIRPIVECAIKIGEIGKAYDAFIKAGGKHVPSLFINNNHEDVKDEPTENTRKPTANAPLRIDSPSSAQSVLGRFDEEVGGNVDRQ
jgi:hypothetical protein